ncbi:MAG: aminotransferase class V-fold PLP-dependent enzyme, partial [Clostridia bacterium]|nr:aminotransferase class V-fold PLP-dependent enzyme [Clostridia bacterium]
MIYLDNAATTFRKPKRVLKAMQTYMKKQGGNPGRGSHLLAMRAADVIFDTRIALARLISALPEQIALMPSATVALNTVIRGLLRPGDHALLSAYEHNAVLRPVHALCDYTVCRTVEEAKNAIRPETKLIAVCHASNVNGKIQDLAGYIALAEQANIPLLVDASQTLGHIPLSADGIDFLVSSGHKGLFGPQGTAFLYVRKGRKLPPLIRGGTGILSESPAQPDLFPESLESGTLNGVGFAGLKAGAEFVYRHKQDKTKHLTDMLKAGLFVIPKVRLYSPLLEKTAPCVA